jgi:hypothetical protein
MAIVAAFTLASPKKEAAISDSSWVLSGRTVPYGFRITNLTDGNLVVRVTLEADDVRESIVGTRFNTVGRATTEVSLAPREGRRVGGVIALAEIWNGTTVVSYDANVIKAHGAR